MHADNRGAMPQPGESLLDVATLAGIWKHPRGGGRALDAERPEQAEDLVHFVRPRFAIVRQGDIQPGMILAGLGIPEHMPCADQPREAKRTRCKPRTGEDGVVKLFLSQRHDQPKAIGVDRND